MQKVVSGKFRIALTLFVINVFLSITTLFFISCEKKANEELNKLASEYVRLALQMDKHKDGYVDAYIGPDSLKMAVEKEDKVELSELKNRAEEVLSGLNGVKGDEMRIGFLKVQMRSLHGVIRILEGEELSFMEEAKILYDIKPQLIQESQFSEAIDEIEKLLPGEGDINERLEKFRRPLILKGDQILPVLEKVTEEVRTRTKAFLPLPANENIKIELVSGKPWGGYNWYKGNAFSLIQINTDLPRRVDQAVGYMTHEGYPGHHTELALREKLLYKDKGYFEYSVYPLYSPQSVISEGIANLGIELIFPDEELEKYHREVLFPFAGVKDFDVEKWNTLRKALKKLSGVSANAAILLLGQHRSEEEVIEYLQRYALSTPDRAKKSIEFIKTYRAYIFNYYYGYNIIKEYVYRGDPEERFKEILTMPVYPSYFE